MKKTMMMMALLACSCTPREQRPTNVDVKGMEAVAKNVFNIPPAPKPTTETDENLVALRMGPYTVSRRTDSRTWFVRNSEYGALADEGAFDGGEDVLRRTAARIFEGLKIDPSEMARARVLQSYEGAAELDDTGQAKADVYQAKQSVMLAERQIGGIPVFSSRMYLALTANGNIGRFKLHWPEIPPSVMEEAKRYQELVRKGWKPPGDGKVASITAGIIHSSPRSRRLEIVPAIRVEYAAGPEGMPRIVYLDAQGQQLRLRRDEHPAPPRQHKTAQPTGAPT